MNNVVESTAVHAVTLPGLFRERVRLTPNTPAYTAYDRARKDWITYTWSEMAQQIARWQAALKQENLQRGDRVAILLKNSPEWVMFDQAALSLGLIVVPLYTEDRPDNVAYVLQDAGVKLMLVQDSKHWEKLLEGASAENLEKLECAIILGDELPVQSASDVKVRLCLTADWLPVQADSSEPVKMQRDDLATIVYTSGTTGKPKGVMLSHGNILSIAEAGGIALSLDTNHRLLSFLPLSHTFERTCGYYIPIMYGMEVVYARSIQQLAEDLQVIKPTALVSVPRIFERVYERLQEQIAKKSIIARRLFHLTVSIGWKRFQIEQGQRRWGPTQLLWPWLKKLVADKILVKFGGNLSLAVCGGAALPTDVAKVFLGLGVNILQGYGMTESSPVISVNQPNNNDPASVGPPLPGIEIRTGENDELQIKGPGIMLGYWNNHRATRDVIMPDGWLRTGDKASIEAGRIYITGRIKDILVMSNGEKIPPVDMENAIMLDPLIDHAVIVGEAKPFLGALLVLNSEHWFDFAKQHHLDPFDQTSLNHPKLQRTLVQHIAKALSGFPGYAKVRRVKPMLDPWTVENGLLTPTLKTKRQLIISKFADQIEGMYTN